MTLNGFVDRMMLRHQKIKFAPTYAHGLTFTVTARFKIQTNKRMPKGQINSE